MSIGYERLRELAALLLAATAKVHKLAGTPMPDVAVPGVGGVGQERGDWMLAPDFLIVGEHGLEMSIVWLVCVIDEISNSTKFLRRFGPRSGSALSRAKVQFVLDAQHDELRVRVADHESAEAWKRLQLLAVELSTVGGARSTARRRRGS